MRTARARISGEKRFDFLFMAPSSQSLEPPQYPGRFMHLFMQNQSKSTKTNEKLAEFQSLKALKTSKLHALVQQQRRVK
jgi:hypothetical protein